MDFNHSTIDGQSFLCNSSRKTFVWFLLAVQARVQEAQLAHRSYSTVLSMISYPTAFNSVFMLTHRLWFTHLRSCPALYRWAHDKTCRSEQPLTFTKDRVKSLPLAQVTCTLATCLTTLYCKAYVNFIMLILFQPTLNFRT